MGSRAPVTKGYIKPGMTRISCHVGRLFVCTCQLYGAACLQAERPESLFFIQRFAFNF